jgi:hypothetical protein
MTTAIHPFFGSEAPQMWRTAAVVVLILATMVTIKDGRALRETGVIASCSTVATPTGESGHWEACRPGKLEGRPDLKRQSCQSIGVLANIEYWRCPSPVESGP